MEVKGTIKKIYDLTSGKSAKGDWQRQDFIISIPKVENDPYPDEMLITAFGEDKINLVQHLKVGQNVTAVIDFKVREVADGKVFNSINLFRFNDGPKTEPKLAEPIDSTPTPDDIPW